MQSKTPRALTRKDLREIREKFKVDIYRFIMDKGDQDGNSRFVPPPEMIDAVCDQIGLEDCSMADSLIFVSEVLALSFGGVVEKKSEITGTGS
jgi:hypothetical protein